MSVLVTLALFLFARDSIAIPADFPLFLHNISSFYRIPDDINALTALLKGNELAASGKHEEAIAMWLYCVDLRPDSNVPLNNIANSVSVLVCLLKFVVGCALERRRRRVGNQSRSPSKSRQVGSSYERKYNEDLEKARGCRGGLAGSHVD
jgi:hypothetical protein